MAPDFEMFRKIEIMRMISFLQADLRLAPAEDVHSSRIEDCVPMRMASLHFCRLRPNQFEKDQAWVEEDQAKLDEPRHSEVKLSLYVFQTYSFKETAPYSIPHRPAFANASLLSCVLCYYVTGAETPGGPP